MLITFEKSKPRHVQFLCKSTEDQENELTVGKMENCNFRIFAVNQEESKFYEEPSGHKKFTEIS